MKQGKCIICKNRWISDKDIGKKGKAKCPNCDSDLKVTTAQLSWSVRIHPNASKKYREKIRQEHEQGEKLYPGYGY